METTKRCQKCGKIFHKKPSESKSYWVTKKFCSYDCSDQGTIHTINSGTFKKGQKPWNDKIRATSSAWHKEARKIYIASEQPLVCKHCKSTERIEIDHIDNDHTNQNSNNLQALCKVCHARKSYVYRAKTGNLGNMRHTEK